MSETYLVFHPDLPYLGALRSDGGSAIALAGVRTVSLGECETVGDVLAAVREHEVATGHALDETARIEWPGSVWLLRLTDIRPVDPTRQAAIL